LNITFPLAGEIFSLCSAVFWALAVIFFFTITLLFLGESIFTPEGVVLTNEDFFRLIVSGIIGIGIADIIFLHSLNIIGAGISALVDTVYSPFVIFFAYIFLGEHLSPLQFLGAGCIIGAIIFASLNYKISPPPENV